MSTKDQARQALSMSHKYYTLPDCIEAEAPELLRNRDVARALKAVKRANEDLRAELRALADYPAAPADDNDDNDDN